MVLGSLLWWCFLLRAYPLWTLPSCTLSACYPFAPIFHLLPGPCASQEGSHVTTRKKPKPAMDASDGPPPPPGGALAPIASPGADGAVDEETRAAVADLIATNRKLRRAVKERDAERSSLRTEVWPPRPATPHIYSTHGLAMLGAASVRGGQKGRRVGHARTLSLSEARGFHGSMGRRAVLIGGG